MRLMARYVRAAEDSHTLVFGRLWHCLFRRGDPWDMVDGTHSEEYYSAYIPLEKKRGRRRRI